MGNLVTRRQNGCADVKGWVLGRRTRKPRESGLLPSASKLSWLEIRGQVNLEDRGQRYNRPDGWAIQGSSPLLAMWRELPRETRRGDVSGKTGLGQQGWRGKRTRSTDMEGRVELMLRPGETGGCSQGGCLSRLCVQVARTGLSRTSTLLMGVVAALALPHAALLPDRAVGYRGCRSQRQARSGTGSEDRVEDTGRNRV